MLIATNSVSTIHITIFSFYQSKINTNTISNKLHIFKEIIAFEHTYMHTLQTDSTYRHRYAHTAGYHRSVHLCLPSGALCKAVKLMACLIREHGPLVAMAQKLTSSNFTNNSWLVTLFLVFSCGRLFISLLVLAALWNIFRLLLLVFFFFKN